MEREALLPCPFCGGPAYIWSVPGHVSSSMFRVSCESDCISMPARYDVFFTSGEEATKAWNGRAALPAPPGENSETGPITDEELDAARVELKPPAAPVDQRAVEREREAYSQGAWDHAMGTYPPPPKEGT